MPLTRFQTELAHLLGVNRDRESHLAGGAALHFSPNSKRFSNDLDYFHDSEERVAKAYSADAALLAKTGYSVEVEMNQPGFIRAIISKNGDSTKVEWAHDSAWRFMPALSNPTVGYQLHPLDLAVNKLLALVGRDEPRDFLDIMYIHKEILPLGALCWAATGKDPGFTPLSLLEILRRRGKYRPEDFSRLMLTSPVDLPSMKQEWLAALASAETFMRTRPTEEAGCLYYSPKKRRFVEPAGTDQSDCIPHFGGPGGVLPRLYSGDAFSDQLSAAPVVG